MNWPNVYLFCFAVGALWSLAALLLGGFHIGHGHSGHLHSGHGHVGSQVHHGHLARGHVGRAHVPQGRWTAMINPSCTAVFLAWFGGVGYLLTRHSGLAFWIDLAIAVAVGLTGAWLLASFLRFLESREQPLDPRDYEMVGVLGHVSSTIRPNGTGEVIYTRDGARKLVAARGEESREIACGEEVVITRYENGIAYVRTWDAMTQPAEKPESLHKETEHVE